jgi:hypothetical protein
MLAATNLPTADDRYDALNSVPWHADSRRLAGLTGALVRGDAANIIDLAVGTVHARAAVVSVQEAADALFQAAVDLVSARLAARVLERIEMIDPLGAGEPFSEPDPDRLRKRAERVEIENASVRLGAAGNHLVNAYLRLAWEANAATEDDVKACGFDPTSNAFRNWAVVARVTRGLLKLDNNHMSSLTAFTLTPSLRSWAEDPDVEAVRDLRDQIVHRARPTYSDAPAPGRASLWRGGSISVQFPAPPDPSTPTLADVHETAVRAGASTLRLCELTVDVLIRWLRSVHVDVAHRPVPGGIGTVQLRAGIGAPIPREQRDPGPFLAVPPDGLA